MRILIALISVYVCFIFETTLSTLFGRWFAPNLLLLLVIFFNLFRGIRYSIITALFAGMLKDSYSAGPFGLHVFSLVTIAYLTTIIKGFVYQPGSMPSRVLLVCVMSFINVVVMTVMNLMLSSVDLGDVFRYVLVPEVLTTTIATGYVFRWFKKCALRLSV